MNPSPVACLPERQDNPLYIHSVGAGPEVVFLHGWGMHSGVWEKVVAALTDRYRVTVLDLPGHGYSRGVETGHTLEELSRAVAAVTPERASWLGWSLGGLIAQRIAIDAPERVAKLILVSSTPSFVRRPGWSQAMELAIMHQFAANLKQDYRTTLKRFLALEVNGSEQAGEQLRLLRQWVFQRGDPCPTILQDGLAILENTDLRAELGAITCPTLLLMGRRDKLVPITAGSAMCDLLPNARLRAFARAAHAPFLSHLTEFVVPLRAFLDE